MNHYNPKKHHRRSIRLKGYDYAQAGLYFITLCVQNRQHLFGEIMNGEMQLNAFGKIAAQEWIATEEIRKNCTLGAFIIMPNHFHAIISIDYALKESETIGTFTSPSQSIGAIIRGYKGASTKKIKERIRLEEKKEFDSKRKESFLSTGELQFAPTDKEFAPTDIKGFDSEDKKESAPTDIKGFDSEDKKRLNLADIDLSRSIWQRNYYEHIIKNDKAFKNIENYILKNPLKWEEDTFHKKK
ncbi:transposase [Flavicella sediminum]|uniref:transposase n=1 Tax=Flavicella sediminum TaxID=2585141 RepID=UPI001123D361|nr:transposase [Flavicella sediminum]